jgi:hypothetical protein
MIVSLQNRGSFQRIGWVLGLPVDVAAGLPLNRQGKVAFTAAFACATVNLKGRHGYSPFRGSAHKTVIIRWAHGRLGRTSPAYRKARRFCGIYWRESHQNCLNPVNPIASPAAFLFNIGHHKRL